MFEADFLKFLFIENFPALGKSTAIHFIEWILLNPGDV